MKICYPLAVAVFGGAEKYALNLAKKAKASGDEVIFLLNEENDFSNHLSEGGFKFLTVKMDSSFNPAKVARTAREFKRIFTEEKVDVVHVQFLREHSIALMARTLGAKIKIVRTFHRLDQFNYKMKPLVPLYNSKTDAFVAPTEFIRDYLISNGIKNSKISVIFNGVQELKTKEHAKAIGYLGRLSKEKGITEFAQAYDGEYDLLIGGDGPEKSFLENIAAQNKKIKLLGVVKEHEKFFSDISISVLPSPREVLPLSVLESFSAGVPVVAFDIPAFKNVITSRNGSLVAAGNFKGLAAKAVELVESPTLKEKAKNAISDYESKYTIAEMWEKTSSLYKSLLN